MIKTLFSILIYSFIVYPKRILTSSRVFANHFDLWFWLVIDHRINWETRYTSSSYHILWLNLSDGILSLFVRLWLISSCKMGQNLFKETFICLTLRSKFFTLLLFHPWPSVFVLLQSSQVFQIVYSFLEQWSSSWTFLFLMASRRRFLQFFIIVNFKKYIFFFFYTATSNSYSVRTFQLPTWTL